MANKIKRSNFIIVQGWMITDLKLKGNKLMLFAIIYGFSQNGESEFTGSLNYMREWLGGASKNTVIKTLNELIDDGLITKRQHEKDGVVTNCYKVNFNVVNDCQFNAEPGSAKTEPGGSSIFEPGSAKTEPGGSSIFEPGVVQKLNRGSAKTEPNNYIYNNNINIDNKDYISMCGASDDALTHTPPAQTTSSKKSTKEPKHRYGEYENVLLTDKELSKLTEQYGKEMTNEAIKFLDEYIAEKKYKANSHYLSIRRWVIDAVNEQRAKRSKFSQQTGRVLTRAERDMQSFYDMADEWARE